MEKLFTEFYKLSCEHFCFFGEVRICLHFLTSTMKVLVSSKTE